MAIEEKEELTTELKNLIDLVERDDIPTNVFTIEDEDPLVLLGKLNEIIAYLKELKSLIDASNTHASNAEKISTDALAKAIESLEKSTLALTTANNALSTANNAQASANQANDNSSDALMEAMDAKVQSAEALAKANDALNQVVQSLGSKVFDVNGNLLSNVKFTGHNGINVDMDENDNETFNIRLDEDITSTIETLNITTSQNQAQIQTNTENIEQVTKAQSADALAIVGIQSKDLSQDEEIASLQSITTENSQKLQRALLTPMSSPTQLELVGIDTNNSQKMIGIDTDSLLYIDDKLKLATNIRSTIRILSKIFFEGTETNLEVLGSDYFVDGSGYIHFETSGLIITQLSINPNSANFKVDLPKPYSSNKYVVVATPIQTDAGLTTSLKVHTKGVDNFTCHGQWQSANGQGVITGDVTFNVLVIGK